MISRFFGLLLGLALFLPLMSTAQSAGAYVAPPPKHEFRAVWVATVNNLDYPKKPTIWPTAHKEEWKTLLKRYKELGFNAVIFQVRPAGDAFYLSEHAPWSEFLTGRQDLPPKPEYDVLEFLIEETHKQGMEFHAWFNPFRATMNMDTAALSLRHVFKRHRNWCVPYGRRFYLNPGLPQVREHVRDVVAEVVSKYEVDGVHFDDYFYPYPLANEPFPDSLQYRSYGSSYKDIADWRRSNVDAVVEMVSMAIKEIKPHVYFGISPFGVWRNQDVDKQGSETKASVSSYDALYADILKWLGRGWVDYVVPQLYWHIGFEPADHATLQRWWSLRKAGKQLYIGHAAYKVGNDRQEQWYQPDEIRRQIDMARRNSRIDGAVFFRSGSVLSDPLGLKSTLRELYSSPALPPQRPELSLGVYAAPDMKKVKNKNGNARLKWKPNKEDREAPPHYYVIYRFNGAGPGDMSDSRNILHISPFNEDSKKFRYVDRSVEEGKVYTYLVTAANRAHTESRPSEAGTVIRKNKRVKKFKGVQSRKSILPWFGGR